MKIGVFTLFCGFFFSLFGQEIEHMHSIHHSFLENKGQWDKNILFKTHFQGGNLWVQQHKIVFHLQDYSQFQRAHGNPMFTENTNFFKQDVIHLNFIGSQQVEAISKEDPSREYFNYFIGNNSALWASNVHGYHDATLHQLYPGIDLRLIEENTQLKYEFQLQPHANPALIQFDYAGSNSVQLDAKGNLIVATKLGNIQENKPYAYQIINGKIKQVSCEFEIKKQVVQFKLGKYDPAVALIIDPILVFATYSGSVTDNFGMTATYGYDGTAFSAGTVYGNSYPTPDNNAYDVNSNFTVANVVGSVTTDAFISKYSQDGTTMIWTTFLGGGNDVQGTETSHSLICDKQNNLYIYGVTSSTDFPIQGGFQASHGGGSNLLINSNGANFGATGTDIYVAKFSANGQNLLASTYMGGAANDGVNYNISGGNYPANLYDSLTTNYGDQFRGEIMLDSVGNCIIASCTRSTNFPTLNPIQGSNAGMQDGVIFKLTANLSSLLFSTYIGGSNNDACYSIKIDSSYNMVFSGGTNSTNLPATAGAWQTTHNGGKADGFVGKLNSTGTVLQRISYVGTANYDQAFFVEIDRNDNVFLLGQSRGGLFPVFNAPFSNPNSAQFIAKLNPSLTTILNSTVFGNGNTNINISPSAFLVDYCGNIYVSGWGANLLQNTPLDGMSVTTDAFQNTPPNGFDFYLMVINRTFSNLLYGTYLGGNQAREHVDGGTSRFDKNGIVYQSVCGGCGGHSDFPTTSGAWSNTNLSTNCNNILFKFDFEITPKAQFTTDYTSGCAALEVAFNNTSSTTDSFLWIYGDGTVDSTTVNPVITYTNPGVYDVYLYVTDSICLITDTALVSITVFDSLVLNVPDTVRFCSPVEITLVGSSSGTGNHYEWSSTNQFLDQLNVSQNDPTLTIVPPGSTYYFFRVSNSTCSAYDSVFVEFTSSSLEITGDTILCVGEETDFTVQNLNPTLNFTYTWAPDSLITTPTNVTSVHVTPTVSQYIYVTASASNGCLIEDSIWVEVSHLLDSSVQASASQYMVTPGTTVTLTGIPASTSLYSTSWTPSNLVETASSSITTATINQTTQFTYTLTDGICTKSDTTMVKVLEFVCDKPYLFVPNAFSPNKDGENDVLYVRSVLIESMTFRVFDRWGELVFESTQPANGWDGTFNGKACDPDVYDFYLDATCINGQKNLIKGNITLLK